MWNWLRSWGQRPSPPTDPAPQPQPADSPPMPAPEVVSSRAPSTEGLGKAGRKAPRYSFASFDGFAPQPSRSHQDDDADGPIVGIDLGTTCASVAVVRGRTIVGIPNRLGERLTPCVVARTAEGEWLVGEPALRQAASNPTGTVRSFKRLLGRAEGVRLGDESFPPVLLAALILRKARESVEAFLGQEVRRAVITVPACFDACQRQAVVAAAHVAGLETEWEVTDPATQLTGRLRLRLLPEPTAAALAFGLTMPPQHRRVAVVHLGGGSCGVSVLEIEEGVFQVLATSGDERLGGDDFDLALIDHVVGHVRDRHGVDLRHDAVAWERLRSAVEQARIDLSAAEHACLSVPYLWEAGGARHHLDVPLSRSLLEARSSALIGRCRAALTRALDDCNRPFGGQVNELILVGGLTRMPCVQRVVEEVFGRPARRHLHAGDLTAGGAAIQGHQLQLGSQSELLVVNLAAVHPLRAETSDGRSLTLIERGYSTTVKPQSIDLPAGQVLRLRIVQGEEGACRTLGDVVFGPLADRGRGKAQVALSGSIDHEGQIDVSVGYAGGRTTTTRLSPSCGLDAGEIEEWRRRLGLEWVR